ncbi:Transmembrane prolyl 4-hydroxylase [Thelohanellus kitauei]|uniref:Transmembrane prolyl 4-hydroxylase n=1 Tax=Thelohanellus kitauei TaxID=669202 RepID=A0A0C2M3W1_THEKT|nr:Transmembrane prolyl 4-hydroxylase [Thelohanellus kitauei]
MTALVYLNDVPKGGETSFPVADDPDYTHEEYLKRKKGDLYNLSQFCYNGSLVVSPKKGKLVMWYNHMITDEGMLGILDQHSLHGGCDVSEGEKWIANNWIPGPESPDLINKNIFKPRAYETDSKPSDAAKEDL